MRFTDEFSSMIVKKHHSKKFTSSLGRAVLNLLGPCNCTPLLNLVAYFQLALSFSALGILNRYTFATIALVGRRILYDQRLLSNEYQTVVSASNAPAIMPTRRFINH